MAKQKILILGGGFGGVKAALLASENTNLDVTLISDQQNFRYYPTLYRAATGGDKDASSFPLSEVFQGKPVHIVQGEAKSIDRKAKTVKLKSGKKHSYDTLVIALGVVTNFFDIKGLEKYAYGIKTLEQAHKLRNHLHQQLVDENTPDSNYVIIGGGPTGVELAGALPSYVSRVMQKHGIEGKDIHVDLVEAAPRLMPRMPKRYSKALEKRLRKLGVHLYLNQTVQAQKADELMVSGHPIDSHTVVWTAGVTNHPFLKANNLSIGEHGKVIVDEYLQAEPGIYVIGDNAETPYSGMAQTALYDGEFVGSNLAQLASGEPAEKYEPQQPVYITPVGSGWAAVLWGNAEIYGRAGWLLRWAADFMGYHDLQPILPATKHWIAQVETEEVCPVCTKNQK